MRSRDERETPQDSPASLPGATKAPGSEPLGVACSPQADNYGAATAPPGVAVASAVFALVTPVFVRENEPLRL